MSNSILEHDINCAHHNKIETLQDLKKETGWTEADWLGSEVIALMQPQSQLTITSPVAYTHCIHPNCGSEPVVHYFI